MTIESAVVLAAGEGTRLRPLTEYRPKPMLPAANRPILEYVLDALVNAGVEDLHVVVGYERDRVQNHFGPTYRGCPVTYHHQEKQLGSGHALLQAEGAVDSDFLVVNGDEVVGNDVVEAVVDAHARSAVATLAVVESEEAPEYGAVRLDGSQVTELIEKPREGDYRLLNAGVYAFGPSIFTEIDATPRTEGELGLTETIARVIDRGGSVHGVRTAGIRTSATYPWDLLELATELLSHGLVDEAEQEPGVYVDESATVHPTAALRAPVVVGADAVVEPGTVVGPFVAVGENATVEASAVVERSVVDADTRIGLNATVVDTVTGTGVRIGEGVTVTRGPGDVRIDTTVHEAEQLGGVVADRARLGGGVTVEPGAMVGPEASVGPGVVVSENVDAHQEVRR